MYGGILALVVGLIVLLITGFYPIDAKSLCIILSSGFLTTIYLLPYYKALSLDDTSQVIPLFQFYPIFVVFLSFLFLHERFSLSQCLGASLIVGGGFLLSVKRIDNRTFKLCKSFFYMLFSSFIFAVAQVLYKLGVNEISFWHTLPFEAFGIALGALIVLFYNKNFKKFINETKKFKLQTFILIGVNEFIYILARYTGYFAISVISVTTASVLASFQPLFVLIYGVILSLWFPNIIKEITTKKTTILRFASISIMMFGTYLIFL